MTDQATSPHRFAQRVGALLMRIRPAPLAVAIKTLVGVSRIEVATREGKFWLDPASDFGQRLLAEDVYEPEMIAVLRRILRPGGTFADVGANEGYFSVIAAGIVGATGHVLAVEPQYRLQPVLRRNFELNAARHTTLVAAAVSDTAGEAQLNLAPSMNTGATSLMQRTRYRLKRQAVPMRTLDTILSEAGIERVDLLKLDIEGWEYEAILGSRALFAEGRIRALALELHPEHLQARGLTTEPIVDFLRSCGYRHASEFETLVFTLAGAVG